MFAVATLVTAIASLAIATHPERLPRSARRLRGGPADLDDRSVTAAHIHFGERAVAGGVIAFQSGGGDKRAR